MSPEEWARVAQLYESALAVEPAARASFIAAQTAGDEALRRELESLLAQDGAAVLIDQPILEAAAAVLEPDASLEPDTRLGPYRIEALLGAGGMGQVYRATDTRLDRTVAVKVLPAAVAADPEFRARFEREAHAIASLAHPHICTLHDVGQEGGVDYLVLEYLEGETLAARLERGPLPFEQALACAVQIVDALDAAHRRGIVHRDLKPGNIFLLRSRGAGSVAVKLLDFGLAKPVTPLLAGAGATQAPTRTSPLTSQGAIVGTLQYMAPEQLEGREADARTDLFAFGAVVYELFTGKKAFEGKSQASLIGAIMHADPPPLSRVQAMSPPALDYIVKTCLAKDPDDRWQSARDLLRELRRVEREPATPTAAVPASRRGAWQARLGLITGAAALTALSVLAWVLPRFAEQPAEMRLEISTPPASDPATFALSPDGQMVVFAAANQGRSRLWLRLLQESAPRALEGTEEAAGPFWSPDSRSVGFFGMEDSKCSMLRVDRCGRLRTRRKPWAGRGTKTGSSFSLEPESVRSGASRPRAVSLWPPRNSNHCNAAIRSRRSCRTAVVSCITSWGPPRLVVSTSASSTDQRSRNVSSTPTPRPASARRTACCSCAETRCSPRQSI